MDFSPIARVECPLPWFAGFVLVVGIASAIVAPYIVVDFLNGAAGADFKSSDWAAWAQAVGSILAVGAAAWIAIFQQQNARIAQDEIRERKNFAARSMLPAALSELADYVEICLDGLKEYKDSLHSEDAQSVYKPPRIPTNILRVLQECIEFADIGPRVRLAKLIEWLQIQNSRLLMIAATRRRSIITSKYSVSDRIVDTLELYARLESLFPYARRITNDDPGEPTRNAIFGAASIHNFQDDEDVMLQISRKYELLPS